MFTIPDEDLDLVHVNNPSLLISTIGYPISFKFSYTFSQSVKLPPVL